MDPDADDDGPLFLVATIHPRPESFEQVREQLEAMRSASVAEPGCLSMHLTRPHDDPTVLVMLEMFASRAAWEEHMDQPHNTGGNAVLEPMLARPTDLRLLDRA